MNHFQIVVKGSQVCNKRLVLSIYALLVVSLLLTGCASVHTQQEWERVNAFAIEKTGVEVRWEQSEEDVRATKEEVNRLLSDGLTMDN